MSTDCLRHPVMATLSRGERRIHATAVAVDGLGVLLMGPSGAGKSDLALRLIDRGARLVADDVTVISSCDDGPRCSATARGRGLIEARGAGILRLPDAEVSNGASLVLRVDLVPGVGRIAELRLPDANDAYPVAGRAIPMIRVDPHAASAPIIIERVVRSMIAGNPAIIR